MQIILASGSPRRKEILEKNGYKFHIIKSDFDESLIKENNPIKLVEKLSFEKAKSVYNSIKNTNEKIIIGADTIVVFENKIIGKPKDKKDAFNTLKKLSNNIHIVYTGYTIFIKNNIITGHDESKVLFNNLDDNYIKQYVDSGSPLDKAGSYGIQDGYDIVKSYTGSFTNIIGLPIEKIKPILDNLLK